TAGGRRAQANWRAGDNVKLACVMILMVVGSGCISNHPAHPATTQPVTEVDPALAEKEYWLAKPAVTEVRGAFDSLWEACEQTAHEYHFRIDRRDQRSGLLSTEP